MTSLGSPRLVLLVPVFPKASETFIVSKLLGLLERGWDAHVVCDHSPASARRSYPRLRDRPDIERRIHLVWPTSRRSLAAILLPFALLQCALRRPRRTWRYLTALRRSNTWMAALRRLYIDAPILRLAPDIVHFEFGALAVERTDLCAALGCRMVVSFRGYDLNFVGLEQDGFYRGVFEAADAIHFLGHDLRQRAVRRGFPEALLHRLIPPAIDVDAFSRRDPNRDLEPDEGPLSILSIGRLEWKKGYDHDLMAIRHLLDLGIDCRYRIVGDGGRLPEIGFTRHQLGLEAQVEILGELTPAEVRDQLEHADVLLHLAVSEGFCNAVIEAQAMGVPVVCSDADGLAENVEDGVTGYVVPRRDPEAAAQRLEALAHDPDLRRRFGLAGRERARKHFALPAQIDAFEELYVQTLATVSRES